MENIKLTAIYEPCEEGGYIAYIDEISGINTQGETIEEAKENLADAINLMFEAKRAKKLMERKDRVRDIVSQTFTFSF